MSQFGEVVSFAATITTEDCLQFIRDNGDPTKYVAFRQQRLDSQWFYNSLKPEYQQLLCGSLYDPFYKRSEPHNAIAMAIAYIMILEANK